MELSQLQKDQLKFLKNTRDYYAKDPKRRAYIEGKGCKYDGASVPGCTGKGCAIGRHLTKQLRGKIDREYNVIQVTGIKELLPAKLTRLGIIFLMDIQSLHDTCNNWTETGISQLGLKMYYNIEEHIKSGYYEANKDN